MKNSKPNLKTPLATARKGLGLSQLALATRAGVCLNTISLAERSGRMTRSVAERLAPILGVSVEQLEGARS